MYKIQELLEMKTLMPMTYIQHKELKQRIRFLKSLQNCPQQKWLNGLEIGLICRYIGNVHTEHERLIRKCFDTQDDSMYANGYVNGIINTYEQLKKDLDWILEQAEAWSKNN